VPILRVREIRGMSVEELDKKLSEIRAELARLRTMVRAGGAVENPARIRELRKAIAKILTVENEDKLGLRKKEEKPEKKKSKKETKSK
jgi:large subunit ribosomal protein L29